MPWTSIITCYGTDAEVQKFISDIEPNDNDEQDVWKPFLL